jgi:peptidoglycan/xylan/chitin deacetylase (PgdA/CDA1 family)
VAELVVLSVQVVGTACGGEKHKSSDPPATTAASSTTTTSPPRYFAPVARPRIQTEDEEGLPIVIDRIQTHERVMALTFDANLDDSMIARLDAGEPVVYDNPAVVDTLVAQEVNATFFLTGKWVERYPESTARIAANPRFEIASHSYRHLAFAAPCWHERMKTAEMAADVEHSFEVLRHAGVVPVKLFRFPALCFDETALRAIAPTGVIVIGGSGSGDAYNDNAPAIISYVIDTATPGSILVFHLTKQNAPVTAEVIDPIVRGLRADGYTLIKVSDLLASR